jgi:hypothetical protein
MRIEYLQFVYGKTSFRICDPLQYSWHSAIKMQLGCINSWIGIFLLSASGGSYTDKFLLPWYNRAVFITLILSWKLLHKSNYSITISCTIYFYCKCSVPLSLPSSEYSTYI